MLNAEFAINRKAMVDSQLRTSGVVEPWLIAAMGAVPRERFVPDGSGDIAYMDRQISLGSRRMMNPPMATGLMLQQAQVKPDDHILVVGGATGYSVCLLAGRAKSVILLEMEDSLVDAAKANLSALDNISVVSGILPDGWEADAPYSLIIIDGAIEILPQAIADQLTDGGRVVTGLTEKGVGRIAMGIKHGDAIALRSFADCSVAVLPVFEQAAEFVF